MSVGARAAERGSSTAWWRAAVASCLLVALLLRVGLVLETRPYPLVGDALDYNRHAQSIAETGHYPRSIDGPDGGATAFRPPLYPYFLAPIYLVTGVRDALEIARLAEALLGVAIVALVGLLSRRLWGRRVALIALALTSVYPPLIVVGGALLSEALFVTLELAACLAVLRAREARRPIPWIALAGLLCGLAALTRSIGIALILPIALSLAAGGLARGARRRALLSAATLLMAGALTLAPWTVRNALTLHSFTLVSTEGGATLAGGYNATVGRQPPAQTVWAIPWTLPDFAQLYWRSQYRAQALRTRAAPGLTPTAWRTRLPEPVLDQKLRAAAAAYAFHHPVYALERTSFDAAAIFGLLGPRRVPFSFEEQALEKPRALRAAVYSFYIVLALAILGAVTRKARRAPLWFWSVPVVLLLPAVFIASVTRLRAPADPFMIMLAAIALAEATKRLGKRRRTAAPRPA